jgi:hypothetical protein
LVTHKKITFPYWILAFIYVVTMSVPAYGQTPAVDSTANNIQLNKGDELGGYISLFDFEASEIINDPDGNFTWERKGKEFHYRNTIYKIVSTKKINGKNIYKCTFNTRGANRLIT